MPWSLPLRTSQMVLVVKNPAADVRDLRDTGSISGLGKSPGGGHVNPLQCSCLENPMHSYYLYLFLTKTIKSIKTSPPEVLKNSIDAYIILVCWLILTTKSSLCKWVHPNNSTSGFSSSHTWVWELNYKESWVPKNWYFWTTVLEKILESPLDCKEIQPVHPKGDQSWVFIGRTDVEAETPILWPPDEMSWLICKDPDAGKDWKQEEKGTAEDETVGWYHWLNGHGCGWTPGVGDWQGGLACCCSWGPKESDMTEWLNWTELITWQLN